MTNGFPAEPRGTSQSSRSWRVGWLLWLVFVAVVSVGIWQSAVISGWGGQPVDEQELEFNETLTLYARIRVAEIDLVEVFTQKSRLQRDLRMLRIAATASFAATAILSGLAYTLYRKWDLSKWFTPGLRMSLLGGWLVYILLLGNLARDNTPEDVKFHFAVGVVFAAISYALVVVGLAAIREKLEGRKGIGMSIGRGLFTFLAVVLALVTLIALGMVFLVKTFKAVG